MVSCAPVSACCTPFVWPSPRARLAVTDSNVHALPPPRAAKPKDSDVYAVWVRFDAEQQKTKGLQAP